MTETTCERCGGYGRTNKEILKEDVINPDGKVPCPDCEGEGYYEKVEE